MKMTSNMTYSTKKDGTGVDFLKQAAMKRLNMKIRNAQETLGKQLIFCKNIDVKALEPSGLNVLESEHVARWVAGEESGRHCLLALMECHRVEADLKKSSKSSTKKPARFSDPKHLMCGANKRSIRMTSLSKSINLPEEFLCDSGVLYDTIFSKPPSAVLKEGLKMLAKFANERSSTALTTDQINLGLKQIRIDKMIDVSVPSQSDETVGKENVDSENGTMLLEQTDEHLKPTSNSKTDDDRAVHSSSFREEKSTVEAYRLQLIIELLRLHIIKSTSENVNENPLLNEPDPHSAPLSPTSKDSRKKKTKKRKTKVVPKIEELFDADISLQQHQQSTENDEDEFVRHEEELTNNNEFDECSSVDTEEDNRYSLYSIYPSQQELEMQLAQHKEKHLEEAARLSDRELLESNRVLLPYISQLMVLKTSLGRYLDFLEGSKAYLSFGLDKDCDAATLKKAYRAKAVKLHPDKKGGNKEKFQQLNDMYNDILKVKLEESELSDEIESEWKADHDTIDRAQAIMNKIDAFLLDIKVAATTCTELAQASMRWKKKVDKAGELPCPKGISRLMKLMKPTGTKKKDCSTAKECSCMLAEEHLQVISVTVSLMVSELMALLSLGRYGVVAGKNIHFMKNIEHLAKCGLSVQKCVPQLSPIESQIDSLLPRAELSYDLAQKDIGVHDVLVQMFCTSFHTRHLTMSMAADSCVTVALAAAEICLAVKQIISMCDQEFKDELKQNAKRREQHDDMCAEDRAFMAAMAQQQQEESREKAREKAEEKEKEEQRHREEGTELEYLRGQVHSLQVQLRLQNIEALQTLNADVCGMQRKVRKYVNEVVVLDTNMPSSDNNNNPSDRNNLESWKRESADEHCQSLFSLLGELIDSSCLTHRAKYADIATVVIDSNFSENASALMNMFDDSFGWMFAICKRLAEDGKDGTSDMSTNTGVEESTGSSQETETNSQQDIGDEGSCENGSKQERSNDTAYHQQQRLALYPDFRSKVLMVCTLVSPESVNKLINDEFYGRLLECLRSTVSFSTTEAFVSSDKAVESCYYEKVARTVCDCLMRGVELATQDM